MAVPEAWSFLLSTDCWWGDRWVSSAIAQDLRQSICVWPQEHHPDLALGRIPSSLDNSLLHSIETIIIDWSHQIRDVLSKDSAQALLDGLHPLPRVEFEFWDARLMNLQCIHEQVGPPSAQNLTFYWTTWAAGSSVLPFQGPQGTFLVHFSALAAPSQSALAGGLD